MTYSEAYHYGDRILSEAGISEHDIDSSLLLRFITGRDRTFILTEGEEALLTEEEEARFRNAIERREKRIPLQLITGETDFMGLTFCTSEDVLIPRIDTEFLVE